MCTSKSTNTWRQIWFSLTFENISAKSRFLHIASSERKLMKSAQQYNQEVANLYTLLIGYRATLRIFLLEIKMQKFTSKRTKTRSKFDFFKIWDSFHILRDVKRLDMLWESILELIVLLENTFDILKMKKQISKIFEKNPWGDPTQCATKRTLGEKMKVKFFKVRILSKIHWQMTDLMEKKF